MRNKASHQWSTRTLSFDTYIQLLHNHYSAAFISCCGSCFVFPRRFALLFIFFFLNVFKFNFKNKLPLLSSLIYYDVSMYFALLRNKHNCVHFVPNLFPWLCRATVKRNTNMWISPCLLKMLAAPCLDFWSGTQTLWSQLIENLRFHMQMSTISYMKHCRKKAPTPQKKP